MDVAPEKLGEILGKANRLKYKELGPVYIAAAILAEANTSPAEVVAYMEENYLWQE